MKMRLLFIKNNLNYSIAQDIETLKQKFISWGLEMSVDVMFSDLPLKFKDFGIKGLWGLDGIKEQIRSEALVLPLFYHIVYFCYDDEGVEHNLANWTYPNPLEGAAFCEIVYRPDLVGLNGDVLIHESLHAFNRLLDFRQIRIIDSLDVDNNWERTVGLYKPLFSQMLKDYPIAKKIWFVIDLINFLKEVLKKRQLVSVELVQKTAINCGIDINSDLFKNGLATLKCESGLKADAKFVNKDGSVDRGVAQWNSKWHPEITDKMAYDPEQALPPFWKLFKNAPKQWVCYSSNKFKDYLKVA